MNLVTSRRLRPRLATFAVALPLAATALPVAAVLPAALALSAVGAAALTGCEERAISTPPIDPRRKRAAKARADEEARAAAAAAAAADAGAAEGSEGSGGDDEAVAPDATAMFGGMVFANGVPKGVGPLKKKMDALYTRHVVFKGLDAQTAGAGVSAATARKGTTWEAEQVDSYGRVERRYRVETLDEDWVQVDVWDAGGRHVEVRTLTDNGRTLDRRRPDGSRWDAACARYERQLNNRGNLLVERCVADDGSPRQTLEGVHARHFEVNANGFRVSERWSDVYGSAVPMRAPHAVFGVGGDVMETRYQVDGKGARVEEKFFDARGRPTLGPQGVHRYARSYDARGFVTHEVSYGVDLTMVGDVDGVSQRRWLVRDGKVIEMGLLDLEGRPVVGPGGWSRVLLDTDARGLVTRERWSRLDGDDTVPVRDPRYGAHGRKFTYDEAGRLVETTWLGAAGQEVVAGELGWATERLTYDEEGRVAQLATFDVEGEPVAAYGRGWAVRKHHHDERGRLVETRYEDGRGGLVPCADGFAVETVRYEGTPKQGQIITRETLGADRAPARRVGQPWAKRVEALDASGRLVQWAVFDVADRPTIDSEGRVHKEIRVVNEAGDVLERRFEGPDGEPVVHRAIGAAILRRTVNPLGNEETRRLLDGDGNTIEGPEGWASRRQRWDGRGRLLEQEWFDGQDRPVGLRETGVAKVRRSYTVGPEPREVRFTAPSADLVVHRELGYARLEQELDQDGRVMATQYFDATGTPTVVTGLGYSRAQKRYDRFGRVLDTRVFDTGRKPAVTAEGGWHVERRSYDARGRLETVTFMHDEGGKANGDLGYAERVMMYDGDSWRVTVEQFFDMAGRPTATRDGYQQVEHDNDPTGRPLAKRFLDAVGRAVPDRDGAAERLWRYRGERLVQFRTRGPEGALVPAHHGTAGHDRTYDAWGRLVKDVPIGTDGRPMVDRRTGCAGYAWTLDEAGAQTKARCLSVTGDAQVGHEGWATKTQTRDERGFVTHIALADEIGTSVAGSEGWAQEIRILDGRGDVVGRALVGADGKPATSRDGYAGVTIGRDPFGRIVSEAYVDPAGEPAVRAPGWTERRTARDALGRELEVSFHDAAGGQVVGDGFARRVRAYDQKGLLVSESYLAADGQPMLGPDGYAAVKIDYDGEDRETKRLFYLADNTLGHATGGYAAIQKVYDRRGRLRSILTLDAESGRVNRNGPQGRSWALEKREYDRQGNKIEEAWYDAVDRPATGPAGSHKNVWSWDERGQLKSLNRFGANGNPLRGGWAREVYDYDNRGRLARIQYENIMGSPATVWNGVSQVRLSYSAGSDLLAMTYHGIDGQPMNAKLCYPAIWCGDALAHSARYVYELGKKKELRLYDVANREVARLDCSKGQCW